MVLAIEIKERKICKSKWLDFTRKQFFCQWSSSLLKWIFEIFKYSLNILQGEFQEKLNKLESESGNEGGSSYFGQFLNFQFTTELAP